MTSLSYGPQPIRITVSQEEAAAIREALRVITISKQAFLRWAVRDALSRSAVPYQTGRGVKITFHPGPDDLDAFTQNAGSRMMPRAAFLAWAVVRYAKRIVAREAA